MQEGLQLAQQAGFQIAQVTLRMALALTFSMLGDMPRAIACVETKADRENSDGWRESNMLGILALLYLQQGDLEQARVTIQTSRRAQPNGMTNPFIGGTTAVAEAELALAEGDAARALTMIEAQLQSSNLGRIRWLYLGAILLKVRALHALGRLSDAATVLEQARAFAVRVGSRRLLWQVLAQRADIARARGDAASAAADYAHARELVEYIAAHAPEEYRASFLNTPAVQQVLQPEVA
jgi:ATP/maltotriose-dependent transcriptional regulator MalT